MEAVEQGYIPKEFEVFGIGLGEWFRSMVALLSPDGVVEAVHFSEATDEQKKVMREFAKALPGPDKFSNSKV